MVDLDRFEIEDLYEGRDLEFKKAAGRDGRGEVPKSFWETYSAMANTHGGEIVLGIEEQPSGKLSVNGIQAVRPGILDPRNLSNPTQGNQGRPPLE